MRHPRITGRLHALVLATGLCLSCLAWARPALAETLLPPPDAAVMDGGYLTLVAPFTTEAAQGHRLARLGAAFTAAGFGVTALGTGLFFIEDWGGVISGGTLVGLGGLAVLAGVPMWIAGAARRGLALSDDRQALGRSWEIAGITVTASGLAITAAGIIATSLASVGYWGANDGTFIAGVTLLPLGVVVALLVGLPMWAESRRVVWRLPFLVASAPAARGLASGGPAEPFADRWTTQRFARSLPAAVMLTSPPLAF